MCGAKQTSLKMHIFCAQSVLLAIKFSIVALSVICDKILKFHRKFSMSCAYFLKSSDTFGVCFSCSLAAKNSALAKLKTLAMMLVGNISQALL